MEIAILGGGVAGVSTAIALIQKGFKVSVYERHHQCSNIGAGIVVWPNASFILEQLGVLEDVASISGQPQRMQRLDQHSNSLGAIDITAINRMMGYSSYSILRSEFQKILLNKLSAYGVEINYSHTVTNLEYLASEKTRVSFANGRTIEPDIIIGADGRMSSLAREYVCGDRSPNYQGFINWIGVCENPKAEWNDKSILDFWGVGTRFGLVPVNENKAYWAGGVACAKIGERDPANYHSELRELFSSWPNIVQQVISNTNVERINKIYVHDHDPIETWHRANLIVIGDAAHAALPTSGQGACQALEDAWHLATCFSERPRELRQAFENFKRLRMEKTSNIIIAARGFASSLFNTDERYCLARNENSKASDYNAMARGMANLWSSQLPLAS